MSSTLGVSVGAHAVYAVQLHRGRVAWAGSAAYAHPGELDDLVGSLVAQAARRPRRVRVVLERDVVQLRAIHAPPLRRAHAQRYARLEAGELFRRNGHALAVDAMSVRVAPGESVLLAAAAPEPLLQALATACERAGLDLDAVGPAAELLPSALAARPRTAEVTLARNGATESLSLERGRVWRSRRIPSQSDAPSVTWAEPLAALGADASSFAAAYAAARHTPCLSLLPVETRAGRARSARRQLAWLAAAAAVLWLGAAGVHVGRLTRTATDAARELDALRPPVERALALRQDLARTEAALATVRGLEADRSQTLALLAAVTNALGDSASLVEWAVGPDAAVRLVGRAPQAARVVADLEGVQGLADIRLQGGVSREEVRVEGEVRVLDRFTVVARMERSP